MAEQAVSGVGLVSADWAGIRNPEPEVPGEAAGFMAADAAVDVQAPHGFSRVPPPYALLRVSPGERDPVRVILAAQIQLRRWRSLACCETPGADVTWRLEPRQRILDIVAARDAMLLRIRGRRCRA